MADDQERIDVLERGNIYFAYRPKVRSADEESEVDDLDDVQQAYLVLKPHGNPHYRLVVLGRKRLPKIDENERTWGFVEQVSRDASAIERELRSERYETKTRGERVRPAARPAGEGVYALVRHEDHTHLVYVLELPEEPGEAQRDLRVEEEGSYILSVRNPETPSPARAGLREERRADFPKYLQESFEGRRFIEVDPPKFLDHEGAELLFIGAAHDVEDELGVRLDAQRESENTAEILNDLRMVASRHPVEPLFEGTWE